MALLDLGNSGGGLLSQMFGPAVNTDPLGQFMGTQYYDPNDARAAGVSGMLKNISKELLYRGPRRGGDFATLGHAMSAGGTGYKEGKSSYLQQGMAKKLAADELRRKQKAEDDQLALERDAVNWIGQFDPKTQEMINSNPTMAKEYWDTFLKERASASKGGGSYSKNPLYYYDKQTDSWKYGQLSEEGGVQMVPTPEGLQPAGPGEGSVRAKETGAYIELQTAATSALNNSSEAAPLIGALMRDPNVKTWGTGMKGVALAQLPGTQAAGIKARISQLRSLGFFAKIQELRGMGALSNIEGEVATNALMRAENSQSFGDFSSAMRDFEGVMKRIHERSARMIAAGNFDEMDAIRKANANEMKFDTGGSDPNDPLGAY